MESKQLTCDRDILVNVDWSSDSGPPPLLFVHVRLLVLYLWCPCVELPVTGLWTVDTHTDVPPPPPPQVQPGDLLAAPFSEDGAFYRARVLAVLPPDGSTSQLSLQFIDYGNSESSALSGCRLLTPPLLAPAPFAQRCRLAGAAAPAGGWTEAATTAMDTLTGAPDGEVKMVTVQDEGSCWAVRISGLGGEDVADALVKDGHAVAETTPAKEDDKSTDEDAKSSKDAKTPVQESAPAAVVAGAGVLVPGRPVAAAVAFSLGPCEFWAQLLSDSGRLDALMEALEAAGELETDGELPVAPSPADGALVAVRYAEDGALYRARVLPDSDPATGSRRVLFIDYGNCESVPAGELRSLPAELAAEPALAVRCSLAVRPAEGDGAAAAAERFAELADGELELELTLLTAADPAIVTLKHEGRDLAKTLVEEALAVAVPVKISETDAGPGTETAGDQDGGAKGGAGESKVEEADVKKEQDVSREEAATSAGESQMEDPGEHEVFVSHVNSPLEFYVQSPDTTELDDLMERLASAGASLTPLDAEAAPTELLAAPFSEDEALYRARVLSTADGRARVLFVDYGNGEEVELTALRRLPLELTRLRPQALRCRLSVEACAAAATDRLREVTEEGALMTRLADSVDADGPVALVQLTVDGKDVAETLSAAGLCRPARRLTLPPALPPQLDTDMVVRVTHVDDDGEVYVVPVSDADALRELRGMTAELYAAEPPAALAAPATDDLCVVQGPDGDWYRAAVLAVDSSATARLRLVDSGATLETPLAQLRQPLQGVALLPPLAHHCRLAQDTDERTNSMERVREACSRSDGVLTVRLTAGENKQLVMHLSIGATPSGGAAESTPTGEATAVSPTVEASETDLNGEYAQAAAKASGDVTDGAETEASVVPAVTPSPSRHRRDDKIVPGQISFSLIVPPVTEEAAVEETKQPAGDALDERSDSAHVPDGQPQDSTEDTLEREVGAVGTPEGTPLGRHLSHEYKIVPGQISFSLLTEPDTAPEVGTTADTEGRGDAEAAPDTVQESAPKDVTETELEEVSETKPEEIVDIKCEEAAETTKEQAVIETKSEEVTAKLEKKATTGAEEVTAKIKELTTRIEEVTEKIEEATAETEEMTSEDATAETEPSTARIEQATVETEQATAGTEQATVGTEQATAGTEQATAETEQATAETEQATVEIEQATVETEHATAGTEQATAGTEQATAGTEQATAKIEEVDAKIEEVGAKTDEAAAKTDEASAEIEARLLVTETVENIPEETPALVTPECTEEAVTDTAVAVVTDTASDALTVTSAAAKPAASVTFRKQSPKVGAKPLDPIIETPERDEPSAEPVKLSEETAKSAAEPEEPSKTSEEPVKPSAESKTSEEPSKSSEEPAKPSAEPEISEEPSKSSEEPAKPSAEPELSEEPKSPEEATQPSEDPETSEEPSKSSEEPARPSAEPELSEEPSKSSEESVNSSAGPEASAEPSMSSAEPELSEEPSKTSEERAKPSAEPDDTEEPSKSSEEPVKSSAEPETSEEPSKSSEEPVKSSAEPETSEEPSMSSEEPAKSSEPDKPPAEPEISEEPFKSSEEPARPSGEPETPEEPSSSSEEPEKSTEEPSKPSAESETSEEPSKSSAEPEKSAKEPSRSSEEPAKLSLTHFKDQDGAGDAPAEISRPTESVPETGGPAVSDSGDAD